MNKAPRSFASSFSMAELLVHALAIEMEAVQSYQDLTQQMRQCGNDEVAELFEKMSALEAEHAEKIRQHAGDLDLPELAPWEYRWPGLDSPENVDLARVHYLMTPYQALKLALENETEAMAFFDAAANGSTDDRVRALAQEFADDERQHVAWMQDWLTKYTPPHTDWDHDPDPPTAID